VGGDDIWILSASHKLAEEGVFGSDLFAGFFNADRHYFLNLPLHHFLQAALFKIAGSGIGQVRFISLLLGIALVWLVSWLALRWFGASTAVLTALLLVLWRSSITGADIPLLLVSRNARYDVGAVWWMWLTIAALFAYRQRRSPGYAFLAGLSCGLAILTQFFGVFTLLLIVVVWWTWHRVQSFSIKSTYALIAGLALPAIPYFVYIMAHLPDFLGQRVVSSGRLDFLSWQFYRENILGEGRRYLHLLDRPGFNDAGFESPSAWLFIVLIIPIIWNLIRRYRRQQQTGDFLLLTSLMTFFAGLLFFEQVKAPVYAIVLVPSISMGAALLLVDGWHMAKQASVPELIQRATPVVIILLILFVSAEGLRIHALNLIRGREGNQYAQVGERLGRLLPPESNIIGFERWWWPLRDRPYRSWMNLWSQWQWWHWNQPGARPLTALVAATGATHLIITRIEPIYLQRYEPALQSQFQYLRNNCTTEISRWRDPEYGEISVYQLVRDPDDRLSCTQQSVDTSYTGSASEGGLDDSAV